MHSHHIVGLQNAKLYLLLTKFVFYREKKIIIREERLNSNPFKIKLYFSYCLKYLNHLT